MATTPAASSAVPTLFLGAGASLAAPAGLPLFGDIRQAVLDASGASETLQRRAALTRVEARRRLLNVAAYLAPEAALYALRRAGVPVNKVIVELMNQIVSSGGGRPNSLHCLAAEALRRDGKVWTTNYDTLIEDAHRSDPGRFGGLTPASPFTSDPISADANLFKIHGSFPERSDEKSLWDVPPKGSLAFDVAAVVAGLRPDWEASLRAAIAGRDVIVIGYRGIDVDLYPVLTETLPGASSVTWFTRSGYRDREARAVLDRYPFLRNDAAASHRLIVEDRPDVACFDHVVSRWPDLHPGGIHPALEVSAIPRDRLAARFLSTSAVTREQLLSQLGFERFTRPGGRAFRPAPLARSIVRQFRGTRFLGAPIRSAAELPVAPVRDRVRYLAGDSLIASETWPSTTVLARWHQENPTPGVRLPLIRRLYWEGRLDEALRFADEGIGNELSNIDDTWVPDRVGGLAYWRSEILRCQGRTTEAVTEVHRGLPSLCSTVLALWLGFTELACPVIDGVPLTADERVRAFELREAMAVTRETGGTAWLNLLLAVNEALRGDLDLADAILETARRESTDQHLNLLTAEIALHQAELARRRNKPDGVRQHLAESRSASPLIDALGDLVQAVDARQAALAAGLRTRFDTLGCAWGVARADLLAAGGTPQLTWL